MPWIVKATRADCHACGGTGTERYDAGLPERCCVCKGHPGVAVLSDVAVATPDEARSKVIAQIDLHGHARDRRLAHATADDLVTEQGGKVSLPDGGEIEVAALALVDLAYRAGMRDRWLVAASATEVCDAYNARAEG